MKKHYGQYLKGVRNSRQLRAEIMEQKEMKPILDILYQFKEQEMYAVA
jgi:tRNA-dihydrouridine synthase